MVLRMVKCLLFMYRLDLIGYPYRIYAFVVYHSYRLDLTALPLGSKYQVASSNPIPMS